MADGQQAGRALRIGFLDASTAFGMAVLLEAFRQRLRMARQLRVEFEGALDSSNRPESLLQFDIPIDPVSLNSSPTLRRPLWHVF